MSDAARLAEIEKRLDSVTADGSFFAGQEYEDERDCWPVWERVGDIGCHPFPSERADAEFVAHARDDIRWLIDQVRGKA